MFSGKNVRCNRCGALMRAEDEFLYCDECGNEGYLDIPDPEDEDSPMQMASPNGYSEIYENAVSFGTFTSWDDPEDL